MLQSSNSRAATLGALVLVTAVGLAGFALLASSYPQDPVAAWDEQVALWVAETLPRAVEWIARPFTWAGGLAGQIVIGVGIGVVLVRRRVWADFVLFVVSVIGIQVLVAFLKAAFDRPRPDLDPLVRLPASASFPSGHAAGAVVFCGVLAVIAARNTDSAGRRRAIAAAAAVLALAIGLSRIALGVHYLSDVLAGWCLGLAWLTACIAASESTVTPRPRRSSNLAP